MKATEGQILNSALWAAAGDALGWISELVDANGLRRRTGVSSLSQTVAWKRKVGGFHGVEIGFPAGTYSDDTQLRLAVCRATRADGSFDVEAFAKVELPVWASYALGAGRGTKAAAANLCKRDVNWFSNFFSTNKGVQYVKAGGNGAAMRIQPHVWANANNLLNGRYLIDVLRDSLVTHGHMVGICGAFFHARCLAHVFAESRHSGPEDWLGFIDDFRSVEALVAEDSQLSQFWLGAWEHLSGVSLRVAIDEVITSARSYVGVIRNIDAEKPGAYANVLDAMECRGRFVGAGVNTAIAAAYLAWTSSDAETAIRIAANALGSDTDTIATMAGALSGVLSELPPTWPVQDSEYIAFEAKRLELVSKGLNSRSFPYPDLVTWRPPKSQSAVLGVVGDRPAIRGLGFATLEGDAVITGATAWQWVRIDFNQTILCKSQVGRTVRISKDEIPGARQLGTTSVGTLFGDSELRTKPRPSDLWESHSSLPKIPPEPKRETIDELTDRVIRSSFDPHVLGECFKLVAVGPNAVERSIAFAAILSKAMLVRRRKA